MLKSRWAPQGDDAATEVKPEPTAAAAAAPPPPPLAASAPPFTPDADADAYPDPSLDSFAQTAGTDDLFFDDDITPISQPVVEQSALGPAAPEFVPASEAPPPATVPKPPREPRNNTERGRGRGRGRGEGRGRGRGGRGRGGPVGDIRLEEAAAREAIQSAPEPAARAADTEPPADAPTGPAAPTTASVRGDRTLTGGSKRTRLTEAELSAKLASMRSKNEALATAHARAEADAAAAAAREVALKQQEVERKKLAAEKQRVERRDRQQMMGERERNRQRKLNAQAGREWDLDKEGFDGTDDRRRPADEDSHRGRGRGRGGRGRGHEARGGHEPRTQEPRPKPSPQLPTPTDFPDLPSVAKPTTTAPKIKEFSIKGAAEKTDDKNKNQDIRKTDPELAKELHTEPNTTAEEKPVRPDIKKVESFGLEPLGKGASWADDV